MRLHMQDWQNAARFGAQFPHPCAALPTRAAGWLVLLLVLGAFSAQAADVTYLEIPAQLKRKGSADFVTLRMADKVNEGDVVRTGIGARVEVTFSPKRVFRIGQATEIELPSFDAGGGGIKARVNVLLGRFWADLGTPLKETLGDKFEVRTATATIGVKGTQFGVDYNKEDKSSSLAVVDGTVAAVPPPPEAKREMEGPREVAPPEEISQAAWQILVTKDQKVIIRPGETPQVVPLTDEDKKDDWVAFNIARDKVINAK